MGKGHAPAPWANGLYEIMVTDFPRSFAFWTEVLGFEPTFQRPEQKLAHLAHPHGAPHGAQMMLYERDGDWEVAPMQAPIDTLMKYAGYCLSYDSCWAQIYLVLLGEGSNGKSVFMEVLAAVVGPENASSIMLSDVLSEKTIRMHMVNKFFNYSDESGKHIFKQSAVFKNLVQGGTMIVKKLYSQEAMIENRTKFIVSCNEMPQTSDNSEGFFRRMLIVPFNFKISPTDEGFNPFLKEDLIRTELPGIANKLIAAYKELMVSKKFIKPLESIRLVEEYKRENDTIKVFIEDCLVETDSDIDFISNEEIYAKYRIYCEESGYKPYNKVMFGRRFSSKYQEPSVVIKINGKSIRGRKNMKYESNY